MRYRDIEYIVRWRAEHEWEWTLKTPFGHEKTGVARGSRRWAETVAVRAIDVWLLMNPARPPQMVPAE